MYIHNDLQGKNEGKPWAELWDIDGQDALWF
jgi:hypothetical protein